MKYFLIITTILFASLQNSVIASEPEKSVKHLDLPDITSFQEAKDVFINTTSLLRSKSQLNEAELNEIHIITYSLEKAVAYFSDNLTGEQQNSAQQMVELVERIHIGSENNRTEQTRNNLQDYFKLANTFSEQL